jgi:hypothetical protein
MDAREGKKVLILLRFPRLVRVSPCNAASRKRATLAVVLHCAIGSHPWQPLDSLLVL